MSCSNLVRRLAVVTAGICRRSLQASITSIGLKSAAAMASSEASGKTSLVLQIVAASVRIADRAGVIIRDVMKAGNLAVVEKGVNDPQTEADRRAQCCIVASLRRLFPGVAVVGEEDLEQGTRPEWIELLQDPTVLKFESKLPKSLRSISADNICIWVDPLDGTAEYTQGFLEHVTVLIGISVDGEAVAGVIHQPYYNYKTLPESEFGRTIWGIVGLGAFGFDRLTLSPKDRIIVTTRSHNSPEVDEAVAACEPTKVVRVGGAGYKICCLIEGKAHCYLYPNPGSKKWDTCAPEAILHAAGGKLTDVHGKQYRYDKTVVRENRGGILGTAIAEQHAWYLTRLPIKITSGLHG